MKKEVVNEFKDGLNLDLNPIVTPNTVLTDNLNGTFITYNGNEFCLQNDRGNIKKADLVESQDFIKYIPIGAKEHNGIIYIVAVMDLHGNQDASDEITGHRCILGCYPGLGDNNELDNSKFSLLPNNTDHTGYYWNGDIFDKEHPVTIEVQDSYDGSVNLIIVDNKNKPRIINSGFSVLPNNKYEIITRNNEGTNLYTYPEEMELIRTSNKIVNFDLKEVQSGGQLKGGNYTFYLKFGDGDYNKTDIVAESGIISIFKGTDGTPSTISGTLADERTDKMIQLEITGIDPKYSKLYLYYTREYSDTQGYRMTESCALTEPIDIISPLGLNNSQKIWINGFEQTEPINIEELNVDYHTVDFARAEAQHSNMLFLGNVGQKETYQLYKDLENISKDIRVQIQYKTGNILGYVNPGTYDTLGGAEYYDTKHIYNYVGYWPDEYYRFGIVYILNDGSTTPVFNMKGCKFTAINQFNTDEQVVKNDFGVFKTPNVSVIGSNATNPLYFTFSLPSINNTLKSKLSGYFIVRQKRIPLTICQGLSIGVDSVSHTPVTYNGNAWITESFISHSRKAQSEVQAFENPVLVYNDVSVNGSTDSSTINVEQYKTAFKKLSEQTFNNDEDNTLYPSDVLTSAINYANSQQGSIICQPDSNYIAGLELKPYEVSVTIYRLTVNNMAVDSSDTRLIVITDSEKTSWDGKYNGNRVLITPNWAQTAMSDIFEANEELLIHSTAEKNKFIQLNHTLLNTWGVASLDPCVNSSVAGQLDGSKLNVRREYNVTSNQNGLIIANNISSFDGSNNTSADFKCAFISPNTNVKTIGNYSYSNIAGDSTNVKGKPLSWCYFMEPATRGGKIIYKSKNGEDSKVAKFEKWTSGEYVSQKTVNLAQLNRNINLVRGKFLPYIGIASDFNWNNDPNLQQGKYMGIYSIRNNDVSEAIDVRSNDNSPFYTVSNRYSIDTQSANVYRGDCYICTVSMRVIYNFIDNTAPASTEIVDPYSWSYNVVVRAADATSVGNMIAYDDVNLSDVNTVSLGYWISFKCLSSYNLGLRSIDSFHSDEMSLLGSPRSFYPLNGGSTATGNKVPESFLLNDGYSATVGEKRYNLLPNVPYSKSEFANRIMYSNVHITDAFTNGYRTFQGLAYKDYDKQYGAITKLIPLGQNLLIVMEHGLGLVSVNPKALMQTTTGEAIHIYGYGVLPDEMTIISQDYGSKYEHSVIRTPIGVYGIDVDAKKIWRFSDKQGFETISDMKIETFLKDYLEPVSVNIPKFDVRSHYNAFKGDLMFTWKKDSDFWNICYNERQNVWVTRYNWIPIVSENINDSFYSLQFNNGVLDENELDCVKIWSHTPDSNQHVPDPTKWYNNQHVFEFEFVVSDPIGVNKIFDNLQIISNNTQPSELEVAVIGDSYMNKRELITPTENRSSNDAINTQKVKTTSNLHNETIVWPDEARFGVFKWDWRLKENLLVKWQPFKDIYKFGRRIGNIQYKDSVWYSNIEPIIMNDKEVRIRDKWARIRIRYTGEDMAVITAIRTLINI